ncbi:hypothetical protein [Dyella choica]|uniref:Uncharacterized protein n=1 Tax=Dyella choica TaxID=1927959 RepID=A0A3S0R1N0_9GAMM|nr:hypothetical protein [Dyella choica]RUL72161.1 hypothetical protein EKH80_17700 [Dyella choica]
MNRFRRYLVVAVAALAWSSTSQATEVFGITLHAPLTMPECLKRQDAYLSDDHEQCFKLTNPAASDDTLPKEGQVIVNIPVEDRPNYMSGADVVVGLKDGLVVSASVKTHGTMRDGYDVRWLQEAFGKPQANPVIQNIPENHFTSAQAAWSLPDGATVYYNSGEWGPYYGLVRVQLPSASPHQMGVWD